MDPVTRKELFLAKAAGMAVEPPEPVTREEMFLSRISGGASEWSDLGEAVANLGDTLTWDGSLTGKVYVDVGAGYVVKVSNAVPTAEDLVNGLTVSYVEDGVVNEFSVPSEQVPDLVGEDGLVMLFGTVICAPYDNYNMDGLVLPESGIYFLAEGTADEIVFYANSLTIPGYNFTESTIKPVPEKYLPESVDYVILRSSTADSTKKFKVTVDDSGNLTATEVT